MTRQQDRETFGSNVAENYENYFVPVIGAPVARDLVRVAALSSGEKVLDVGCGTGVVTRLAAEKTGTNVAALDLNPGMLAVARSKTPAEMSIEWHEASAEKIPLPDETFDVVLCQMTLQFIPDKPAAVREMHRVLVPGGRLVLNTPGKMHGFFAAMENALARNFGPDAAGFLKAVFSLHDPGGVEDLLVAGGFREVSVQKTTVPLRLPPPARFLWQYLHSTPLVEIVPQMDDDQRADLERDVVDNSKDFVEDGGVAVAQEMLVSTARK